MIERGSAGKQILIRMIEYKDIFQNLVVQENQLIDFQQYFDVITPADQFIKDWSNLFSGQNSEKFETRVFEIVRQSLLNAKGIFMYRERYSILEASLDSLLEIFQSSFSKDSPVKRSAGSEELYESNISIAKPENNMPARLAAFNLDYSMDFSRHPFLAEYYLYMRKQLTALFACSVIDHMDIYVRKMDSIAIGLRAVCNLVPVFGSLLGMAGITLGLVKDGLLKRKLERISDLAVNYVDLPEKVARMMTVLRVNSITMVSQTVYKVASEGIVSKALRDMGLENKLSEAETLAINDSRVVEGILLLLIETKQINVINFPEINELLESILDTLLSTKSLAINADHRQEARVSQIYVEVLIDKEILDNNDYLPRTLLRKKEETYPHYYNRINSFLKVLSGLSDAYCRQLERYANEN